MRKERIAAVVNVTKHLIEAERALDEALQKVALLTAAMSSSRLAANLSAVTAHGAFSRVTTATQFVGQARGELALSHIELNTAKSEIGLREMNFGGGMGCPPNTLAQEIETEIVRLHAV
ncbi:MAG: hypothetical protein RIS52_20 [Pseudomonadota bacterium]|jgi:hypothetical protein